MSETNHVVVVGAGPAGMMASISAAASGAKVTLIERNHLPGRKLLLSGKGRCNLTNVCRIDEFLSHFNKNGEFLRDAFKIFFVSELMDFFKKKGVDLKVERQNRVFPVSDKASFVLGALEDEMRRKRVDLLTGVLFNDLVVREGEIKGVIVNNSETITGGKVILCLGGASYPLTGSDGKWFMVLKRHDIRLTKFKPALTPLVCRDNYGLNGLSLRNIRIRFQSSAGNVLLTDTGEI
ncbi:MAG: aminoacetone oxidase family FAD-binding enzyme, partial [Candidatus Omnitrophota bacterium]